MNVDYFLKGKAWLFILLFLMVGVTDARAEWQLTDNLLMSGFIRNTAVYSIGEANPDMVNYLETSPLASPPGAGYPAGSIDRPNWNLLRIMMQLELDYRPTDFFRFFIKTRFAYDYTSQGQGGLPKYDAFPSPYTPHGRDLQTNMHSDHYQAAIWETWINFETDLWWIRLGKQQIAWGDIPGVRIADKINPLDKSWHLTNEPEEYEHIRIPEWAIRVYFSLPETWTFGAEEVYIDTFWNPGDIHHDLQPDAGSPYTRAHSWKSFNPEPYWDYYEKGWNDEYGIRIGANVSGLQASFIYASVHDDFQWWSPMNNGENYQPFPDWGDWGDPVSGNRYNSFNGKTMSSYWPVHSLAWTLSYAFPNPWNFSFTYEGSCSLDQRWQDRDGIPIAYFPAVSVPGVSEGVFWRNAIYLERVFFGLNSLSKFFYPSKLGLMYYRHWIDKRDEDYVKLTPANPPSPPNPPGTYDWTNENRIDRAINMVYISYTLPFGQGASWQINPKLFWYTDAGGYKAQCFLQYSPDLHWRFDVGCMWQGGRTKWAFTPGADSTSWNDELYGRITYTF